MAANILGSSLHGQVDSELYWLLIEGRTIAVVAECDNSLRPCQVRNRLQVLQSKIPGVRRFQVNKPCIWKNCLFKIFNSPSINICCGHTKPWEDNIEHAFCPGVRFIHRNNVIPGFDIRQYTGE